jgi:hypothetical protein
MRRALLLLLCSFIVCNVLVGCTSHGSPQSSPSNLPSSQKDTSDGALPIATEGKLMAEQTLRTTIGRATARLLRSKDTLEVTLSTGQTRTLRNPFGEAAQVRLVVISSQNEDHLLVTATIERPVLGWVLVPTERELSIALEATADWDISVEDSLVKVSSREYSGGKLGLTSKLYRYRSSTGSYELVSN